MEEQDRLPTARGMGDMEVAFRLMRTVLYEEWTGQDARLRLGFVAKAGENEAEIDREQIVMNLFSRCVESVASARRVLDAATHYAPPVPGRPE